MAFVVRRPFAITAALRNASQATKSNTSNAFRQFHRAPLRQTPISARLSLNFRAPAFQSAKSSNAFNFSSKRAYSNYSQPAAAPSGELGKRVLYGVALFGGTVVAINLVFNRETREDGGMPPYEKSYLNDTFLHTGLGLGTIAVAARALHRSGWSYRLMAANPWLVFGVGLAGSIGTMIATRSIAPENYIPKYACWTAFNITQALILSPLLFVQPALLARAGLYTVGMMGSIAFVGATAKQEKYLYLGGPLLAGVAIVALSGLAPLVLPVTAARTLMFTENLWLYGGLAVFGGFTLYDVQKILYHARLAQQGIIKKDAVNESIALELDFLNIFIRMVQILGMQQRRK